MAVNKNFVVKNGLEVDTNTLFVDSANNRVAIGTTVPTAALDVRGKILSESQVESFVGNFVGIVTAGAVGVTTGAQDPTIYLARGQTYEFDNQSGGSHPFAIRASDGGSNLTVAQGVINNAAASGVIRFEIPFDASNTLVYQCTSHSSMLGNIVVYPSI